MSRYDLRGALTRGGAHAEFFFATWANGELYFGPRLDVRGDYVRRSFHKSGTHLVHEPPDDTLLENDVPASQETRRLGKGSALAEFTGAREMLVTLPKTDQLHWQGRPPKTGSRRVVVTMEADDLPDSPLWSFRFWLVDQSLETAVDEILNERPILGKPRLIRECQPMLLGFFMEADELVIRTWMEGVRQTKEPGAVTIYTGP